MNLYPSHFLLYCSVQHYKKRNVQKKSENFLVPQILASRQCNNYSIVTIHYTLNEYLNDNRL